jgi:hypothetical protein
MALRAMGVVERLPVTDLGRNVPGRERGRRGHYPNADECQQPGQRSQGFYSFVVQSGHATVTHLESR